jgi:hypothetical protein
MPWRGPINARKQKVAVKDTSQATRAEQRPLVRIDVDPRGSMGETHLPLGCLHLKHFTLDVFGDTSQNTI